MTWVIVPIILILQELSIEPQYLCCLGSEMFIFNIGFDTFYMKF